MGSGAQLKRDQQVRFRLTELTRTLEQIESVVGVCTSALRHQNCERDADVARVLQRDVADRLSVERDKLVSLLRGLKPALRAGVPARTLRK